MLSNSFVHDMLVHSQEGHPQPLSLPCSSYFLRQCLFNCGVGLGDHSPIQAELRLQALTFRLTQPALLRCLPASLLVCGLDCPISLYSWALDMLYYVHMRNFSELGGIKFHFPCNIHLFYVELPGWHNININKTIYWEPNTCRAMYGVDTEASKINNIRSSL